MATLERAIKLSLRNLNTRQLARQVVVAFSIAARNSRARGCWISTTLGSKMLWIEIVLNLLYRLKFFEFGHTCVDGTSFSGCSSKSIVVSIWACWVKRNLSVASVAKLIVIVLFGFGIVDRNLELSSLEVMRPSVIVFRRVRVVNMGEKTILKWTGLGCLFSL